MCSVYYPEQKEIVKFAKIVKPLYNTKQSGLFFQNKKKARSPQKGTIEYFDNGLRNWLM